MIPSGGHILFVRAKRIWKEKHAKGGARKSTPFGNPQSSACLYRHKPSHVSADTLNYHNEALFRKSADKAKGGTVKTVPYGN